MNLFEKKLSKLSITAYSDREMSKKIGSMDAMYNPSTLTLSYSTAYGIDEFINSPRQNSHYQQIKPGELSLELVFDARMPGNTIPIDAQLSQLRHLCCTADNKTNEPYFLKVKWGKLRWSGQGYFAGRLSSLSVQYSLFDRDAEPLRAFASLSLLADESLVLQQSLDEINSPKQSIITSADMTSVALVTAAMAGVVAANNIDYLSIAYQNGLDSLDGIILGQSLAIGNSESEGENNA